VYVHAYLCMCKCMNGSVVFVCICMNVYVCVCLCMYVCVCVYMYVRMYVCACVYVYVHVCCLCVCHTADTGGASYRLPSNIYPFMCAIATINVHTCARVSFQIPSDVLGRLIVSLDAPAANKSKGDGSVLNPGTYVCTYVCMYVYVRVCV